jgi:hypothetical protein
MVLQKVKLASKTLGVSGSTLKKWRQLGQLVEGVHYTRQSYNLILYNPDLIAHWLATRSQPELHDRKIREYLASLEPETAKGKRKAA